MRCGSLGRPNRHWKKWLFHLSQGLSIWISFLPWWFFDFKLFSITVAIFLGCNLRGGWGSAWWQGVRALRSAVSETKHWCFVDQLIQFEYNLLYMFKIWGLCFLLVPCCFIDFMMKFRVTCFAVYVFSLVFDNACPPFRLFGYYFLTSFTQFKHVSTIHGRILGIWYKGKVEFHYDHIWSTCNLLVIYSRSHLGAFFRYTAIECPASAKVAILEVRVAKHLGHWRHPDGPSTLHPFQDSCDFRFCWSWLFQKLFDQRLKQNCLDS